MVSQMNNEHVFQISGVRWRKSTYSEAHGHCVELAAVDGGFAVRDSKNPDGPVLGPVTVVFPRAVAACLPAGRD